MDKSELLIEKIKNMSKGERIEFLGRVNLAMSSFERRCLGACRSIAGSMDKATELFVELHNDLENRLGTDLKRLEGKKEIEA